MTRATLVDSACSSKERAPIAELFHQQVLDKPDSAAVVFEDRQLSYQQLDALANQFANALQAQGVGLGQSVGLCIDRCPEAIAAMLGVFKVGAAFVPLDPEYPIERIQYMIDDARVHVVITHDRESNALASRIRRSAEIAWIDSDTWEFATIADRFEPVSVDENDLAYIMYTSGSTGQPKGVQIQQGALTTYCLADVEVYQLSHTDRTLQFSTLNFDIAIEEIFPPLVSGSSIVVRPRERSTEANELSAIVRKHGVTAIHLATAYWHEWVDLMIAMGETVPDSLRLVIATGEKVSVEHYRRWKTICRHGILWCNAYGPTEATVTATVFIPPEGFDADNMPIGKPLPGYGATILDAQLAPVPDGTTGQLYLFGDALARGYLNRADLTEQAFVVAELPGEGRTRLYRTGDLARYLPDGNIEFAGRVDHQIKLGSYRIEPGEIEAALNKQPAILESLIRCEQIEGQKYLIAYVATGRDSVSISAIVDFLNEHLPPYMVPQRYVLLDAFPKTINGKIDRDALPDARESRTATSDSYVAPRNEMEQKLATLWQSVLQIPRIGIDDDFFSLGGSSLLVTRIIAELTSEFGMELPVRDFFANSTIASSARHLQQLIGIDASRASHDDVREMRLCRERQPIVKPRFINCGDQNLFSVGYHPREGHPSWCASRHHGILICHAYGHEYARSYRNLQQLAIQLCQMGFDVLRFDYHGTGNSSGDCDACHAESMQADLREAAHYLRQETGCGKLSLIGMRLGATVAATARLEDITSLVLWDPVVEGRQMLETLDRFHAEALTSQTRYARRLVVGPIDQAFGHVLNSEKRESLGELTLPVDCSRPHIVVASRDYAVSEVGFQRVRTRWNVVEARDDIHWHRGEFTESAFSSPRAFRAIVRFFHSGRGS